MGQYDKYEVTKGVHQYHIAMGPGDIGEYVLLPGDPARSDRVAKYLDDAKLISNHREHRTFTGTYKGIKVSVTSTGMGCPSTAIAAHELANIGAKTLIRIGSTAAFKDEIKIGDLVITEGAMKEEGTSKFYVPDGFPAVPDLEFTYTLIKTAREMAKDRNVFSGITASSDAFYTDNDWNDRLIKIGVTNCDMEASALFTVAHMRGIKAAAIMGVSSNLKTGEYIYTTENVKLAQAWEEEIKITLETIYRMEQSK